MFTFLMRHRLHVGFLSASCLTANNSLNLFIKASQKTSLVCPLILQNYYGINVMLMNKRKPLILQQKGLLQAWRKFRRFLELFYIFLPALITLPLAFFSSTQKVWIQIFVSGVQRAGVVWIKLFQYLSHRRDVLGQKLAESFAPLRQFSPQHPFSQTQNIFRKIYGIQIGQFFEEFDSIPIASGSVSQVYQGKLHGEKVAIKVRHPNIQKNIQRDISIIFGISGFLTLFSRAFEIPVNEHSLKQMLTEQIFFGKERQNLQKFSQIFQNPDVKFPKPFSETTDEVLIMSFVPGKPISFYENNSHQMNRFIARIGASAFFQMLIQHNFIHADCHGGNIFVQITKKSNSVFSYFSYYYQLARDFVWNKAIRYMLDSQILKKLCDEQITQDLYLKKQLMRLGESVKVILLDVGMVIELQKAKRNYFINFLSEVIQGNPAQCAKMIHRISKYAGQLLKEDEFPNYLNELEEMFTRVRKVQLENLQGIDVLSGMLTVIRNNRMKLDGQFATLLTNMLTLQAIAKDLDPNINILRCAVPYLPYK